jgi:hypothetical protein
MANEPETNEIEDAYDFGVTDAEYAEFVEIMTLSEDEYWELIDAEWAFIARPMGESFE